jgi:PAS domain-containing protein
MGHISKFPIFDQTGAIVMVGGASVEITERIRADEALRESEERFSQAKLLFECEDDSTLDVTIVDPGSSVSIRNNNDVVEYLG